MIMDSDNKEKTMILKKSGHWYVINSSSGNEKEILLTILEYAENKKYNISENEVMHLIDKLGYELDSFNDMGIAS
jgi:hypothetical protein